MSKGSDGQNKNILTLGIGHRVLGMKGRGEAIAFGSKREQIQGSQSSNVQTY
ncbi:hypothetical protein COO91_10878 (plasmid) [Nostoc flagelliforme CCNUN1]|uniref:Uncharacterized protein n=1 Tax=Nostoc flagelliforme CCNUN1 TaxID=2038116 RepID=A0A2K8TAE2_9NOSO|nr:hypothetical protein COO91_10878 [Nostoc flagelliforme CCNUN1]